jgi:hypothetical protein
MTFGLVTVEPQATIANNDTALYDYARTSEEITVGNGNVMIATKIGKL